MRRLLLLCLALLFGVLHASAQDRTITGTVIDRATNEPLPGVTVLLKGTTSGTSTGPDGSFSLSAPTGDATLQFRFLGYQQQEQATGGGNGPFSVSLVTDTKQLGEVVVTALGIEKEKKTLGYATQTIEAAQLTQGRERSVLNSLQGKVAGVQINSGSGGVGSSTRVVIRGSKSLQGENQPLYVIDGIPIDNRSIGTGDNLNNGIDAGNRANDINPEDVESVNILKGPAATALYGSRAATGAIIITTKSGRNAAKAGKKAEVTYTTSYVFEDILRLPEFQNRYGQGGRAENGTNLINQQVLRENFSWGPRFDDKLRAWGQRVNNQQRYKPYSAVPDNVKEFFDIGSVFTNTLSVGGGDQKSNYFLSAANTKQKGITPGTEYDRTSVKISGETKLSNKFTTSANITYTKSGGDLAVTGQGSSVYDQLIQTPRDISLLELKDLNSPFNTLSGYYGAYTTNPWYLLANDNYRSDVDRLFGNAQLGYVFNDHFRINYRIGTDVYADRRRQFRSKRAPIGVNADFGSNPGLYAEAQYTSSELTSDLIGTYNGNISEDITVSAIVGHNINQRRLESLGFEGQALVNNTFQGFDNVSGNFVNSNSGLNARTLRRLYGVYTSVDLGFRDYLFLNATARNDWSSTLPTSNRSFFYPGVGVGFVFTELLGMNENKYLSFGKLRANYAQVGNDAPEYLLDPTFASTNVASGFENSDIQFPIQYPTGTVAGYEVGDRIGNQRLQPEITKSFEFGAELRFLNNRLTIDASYYNANSTEQIVRVPISTASGFQTQVVNAGSIRNKGIELLVSGTPLQVGDFKWDILVNYTRNRNEVEELYAGVKELTIGGFSRASLVATVGDPYGNIKAVDFSRTPDGQIICDAKTGLPVANPVLSVVGNIQPDYTAGLTNSFSYKGASLNVVFDTRQGGQMYSRTRSTQRFVGTAPETLYNDRNPFVVPNSVVQNEDGTFATNTTPVTGPTEYWGFLAQSLDGTNVIDASYVKLREVGLSYALPSKLLEKTPFGGVSFGFVGRNLFLWTPSENTYVDPESSNFGNGNTQGFDFTGSPSLRSYGANLRVTF